MCVKGAANHCMNATWLIGVLFEFSHPHCGWFAGEYAHAAPAKRVMRTVGPPESPLPRRSCCCAPSGMKVAVRHRLLHQRQRQYLGVPVQRLGGSPAGCRTEGRGSQTGWGNSRLRGRHRSACAYTLPLPLISAMFKSGRNTDRLLWNRRFAISDSAGGLICAKLLISY